MTEGPARGMLTNGVGKHIDWLNHATALGKPLAPFIPTLEPVVPTPVSEPKKATGPIRQYPDRTRSGKISYAGKDDSEIKLRKQGRWDD